MGEPEAGEEGAPGRLDLDGVRVVCAGLDEVDRPCGWRSGGAKDEPAASSNWPLPLGTARLGCEGWRIAGCRGSGAPDVDEVRLAEFELDDDAMISYCGRASAYQHYQQNMAYDPSADFVDRIGEAW
jgi:hypothetical protein